jgi:phenylalanyl-tRNA synthetase beta chain
MRDLQLHRQRPAALFGGGSDAVRLENPISSEMTHLRPDLLPGLLRGGGAQSGARFMDLALFEVGPVFQRRRARRTGGAGGGSSGGRHRPARPARQPPPGRCVRRQGRCRGGAGRAGRPRPRADHAQGAGLVASGPVGRVALGPNVMATFGEVHPRVLPPWTSRARRWPSRSVPRAAAQDAHRDAPGAVLSRLCRRWSVTLPLSSMNGSRR